MHPRRDIGVVLSLLLLVGCAPAPSGGNPGSSTSTGSFPFSSSITSIRVSPLRDNLAIGNTLQMSAIGYTSSLAPKGPVAAEWDSDDHSIATVDANGVVFGVKVGIVTLTASFDTMKATAILGVVSAFPGNKSLTVSGKAFYEDKPYTEAGFTGELPLTPIRKAAVNLVAIDGFKTIQSGQTDENGLYRFFNVDNSTRRGGVYIEVLTKTAENSGHLIEIRDDVLNRSVMAITGFSFNDSASDSFEFPNLVARASQIGGAFNSMDLFLRGEEFIQQGGSCPAPNTTCFAPLLTAYWKNGFTDPEGATSYNREGQIHSIFISGGKLVDGVVTGDSDAYDDTILLHEYGHFVADLFSRDDSPGDEHFISDNDQDIRLSWSEGWATFFAAAVLNSPVVLDTNSQGVTLSFNIETLSSRQSRSLSHNAVYTTSEVSVSAVLWDIFDSVPEDDDPMTAISFSTIWNVFTQISIADRATMEWFSVRFMNQNQVDKDPFQIVLKGRKIELFPDTAEAGGEQTLALNSLQHHTLYKSEVDPFSDEDRIPFSVTAGKTYIVKTLNLTNGADTALAILDSGSVLSENDNADGRTYSTNCTTGCPRNDPVTLASSISFVAPRDGVLFAEVKRSPSVPPSAGQSGSYDIKVEQQ